MIDGIIIAGVSTSHVLPRLICGFKLFGSASEYVLTPPLDMVMYFVYLGLFFPARSSTCTQVTLESAAADAAATSFANGQNTSGGASVEGGVPSSGAGGGGGGQNADAAGSPPVGVARVASAGGRRLVSSSMLGRRTGDTLYNDNDMRFVDDDEMEDGMLETMGDGEDEEELEVMVATRRRPSRTASLMRSLVLSSLLGKRPFAWWVARGAVGLVLSHVKKRRRFSAVSPADPRAGHA